MRKGRDNSITGNISYNEAINIIEIHAEGKETDLKKFIALCSKGSPFCKVSEVKIDQAEELNFDRFDIINHKHIITEKPKPKHAGFRIGLFGL